jgi:4-carboxymuconolactone decarboxylase
MMIFRAIDAPMQAADTRTFSGPTLTARLASSAEGTPVHVYRVEFESTGRTHWHAHSGPQWLLVIEGRIRIQSAGHAARDLGEGDAVVIAPGEKHWHGAVPGSRGTHLAVNINFETTWLEPVSDEQYESGT